LVVALAKWLGSIYETQRSLAFRCLFLFEIKDDVPQKDVPHLTVIIVLEYTHSVKLTLLPSYSERFPELCLSDSVRGCIS
jgi:hypothetical protein